MLNSDMNPNPCPVTTCLNSTHHKMPDGMVMLNSDMSKDPCTSCTEYPCEVMSKGPPPKHKGHGHDGPGGGSGAMGGKKHDEKPEHGGSGKHDKKPEHGGSG